MTASPAIGTRWRHPVLGEGRIVATEPGFGRLAIDDRGSGVRIVYDGGADVTYPARGQFEAEGHTEVAETER